MREVDYSGMSTNYAGRWHYWFPFCVECHKKGGKVFSGGQLFTEHDIRVQFPSGLTIDFSSTLLYKHQEEVVNILLSRLLKEPANVR